MTTRSMAVAIAALLGGLALGYIAPQADLRDAREQLATLRSQLSGAHPGGLGGLQGVRSVLAVPDKDLEGAAQARKARERSAIHQAMHEDGTGTNAAAAERHDMGRRSLSNRIEHFKQAWIVRSELARTNFLTRTKLDAKQTADFDTLVDAMNVRLGTSIDQWAAKIRQEDALTPEMTARMMNELSGIMVGTYDELDRKMPQAWRKEAGPRFAMMDFIDPEVLTPLEDVKEITARGPDMGRDEAKDGAP